MSKCKICKTEYHYCSSCDLETCFEYEVCSSCWHTSYIKKTWDHYTSEIELLYAKRDTTIANLIKLASVVTTIESLPTEELDRMLDSVVDRGQHKKYSTLERMVLDYK